MANRKECKECPWHTKSKHSESWPKYANTMKEKANVKIHACHMITSDTWGITSEIDESNMCIGHLNQIEINH